MRPFVAALAIVALLLPAAAAANTHSPCSSHYATPVTIDTVNAGGGEEGTETFLTGAGSISGCPSPVGTETVTLTTCLVHDGKEVACVGPVTKGWSRYWRYARSHMVRVSGVVCDPGTWTTVVRGGDGFAPTEWTSVPATFDCLEHGGAD